MTNCTVDCLAKYSCAPGAPVVTVADGAVFEPYVKLRFGAAIITGGNKSAPNNDPRLPGNNLASIRSFEYGSTGSGGSSFGASFEIIDVGGTMYRQIIHAMNKTVANSKEDALQTNFDFGWIVKRCDGSVYLDLASKYAGGEFYGFFSTVDVSFEGNTIKMKLELRSPNVQNPDSTQNDTEGEESNKIRLKQALINLFKDKQPSYQDVEFRSAYDDGRGGFKPLQFKNSDGGADGPLGTWPMNQQNALAAARTWLAPLQTINDNGVHLLFDPNKYNLVVQENKFSKVCCAKYIATYIVNGGNCSPVLEFNPTIKWPVTGNKGAANPSSASGSSKEVGNSTEGIQKTGSQAQPSVQNHDWQWRSPNDLAAGAADGLSAQFEANILLEMPQQASQLKLWGDPAYNNITNILGTTISIIVINPFYIGNYGGDCTWLTTSNCNSILSNKSYTVTGFNHQITSGSYVTILNVQLDKPNVNLPADAGLGTCGDGETFNEKPGKSEAKPK